MRFSPVNRALPGCHLDLLEQSPALGSLPSGYQLSRLALFGNRVKKFFTGSEADLFADLQAAVLIDLDPPIESEIRIKPTGIVEHGGGPQFPIGRATDKRFFSFL